MKKLFSVFIIVIVTLCVITGCAQNPNKLELTNAYYRQIGELWENREMIGQNFEYTMLEKDNGKYDFWECNVYEDGTTTELFNNGSIRSYAHIPPVNNGDGTTTWSMDVSLNPDYKEHLIKTYGNARKGKTKVIIKDGDKVILEQVFDYECVEYVKPKQISTSKN